MAVRPPRKAAPRPAGKLFISQATKDDPIVAAFVDLLEGGVGIPHKAIFCTRPGSQGVRPGKDFKESIRVGLDGAVTAVALISPNYYASAFSMCELRGVWLTAKDFLPILVPPLTYNDLKAVLAGLEVLRLDNAKDLDALRDELCKSLGVDELPTTRWNERRDGFLKELRVALKKVPPSNVISREQFEALRNTPESARRDLSQAGKEIAERDTLIEKLSKLKDTKAVTRTKAEHGRESEVFDRLIRAAQGALGDLPSIVREALYYWCGPDRFFPREEQWDEVQRAKERGLVAIDVDDDRSFVDPNASNVKIRRAMEALKALTRWLDKKASLDFLEGYEEEYEEQPDVTLRPFWELHNLF